MGYVTAKIIFPLSRKQRIALSLHATKYASLDLGKKLQNYQVYDKRKFKELHPEYSDSEDMKNLYYSDEPFIHEITTRIPKSTDIRKAYLSIKQHLTRYKVSKKAKIEFL